MVIAMSDSLRRCAGAFALLTALLTPKAGALANISVWAQEGVSAAEASGLAPSTLAALNAKGEITRAEFCGVVVNLYQAVSSKSVPLLSETPFDDCDDSSVTAAYKLGLVSGRGNGVFDPNASIERQDLCVMLYNVLDAADLTAPPIAGDGAVEDYPDVPDIRDYAVNAMITMVDYAIVNGISAQDQPPLLAPAGTATREQALIMANRFCAAFGGDAPPPAPVGNASSLDPEGGIVFPDPEGGSVSPGTEDGSVPPQDEPINVWNGSALTLPQTNEEKLAFVYGEGGAPYQTADEAETQMTQIRVKVWRLQEDGSKTTGIAWLEVNRSLAPVYEAIFEEIYHGDEQFPIKNVGCYAWRPGEHGQGTAVDINWEENMEATINEDGSLTPTCGTHWLPGEDPYSIPEGGDVYNAFTKYGFTWGGNAWRSKRDYMHFSYFGR